MKIVMLYHPQSGHARIVEEFVHDFERQNSKSIELHSLETREGSSIATLYDVVQYPAILVLANDGSVLKAWQGERLPLMDEVAGYIAA